MGIGQAMQESKETSPFENLDLQRMASAAVLFAARPFNLILQNQKTEGVVHTTFPIRRELAERHVYVALAVAVLLFRISVEQFAQMQDARIACGVKLDAGVQLATEFFVFESRKLFNRRGEPYCPKRSLRFSLQAGRPSASLLPPSRSSPNPRQALAQRADCLGRTKNRPQK